MRSKWRSLGNSNASDPEEWGLPGGILPAVLALRTLTSAFLLALASLALAEPARAGETELGVGLGTTGIGPRAAFTLRDGSQVRIGLSEYTFGRIEGFDNTVLDAQVRLRLDESFRLRNVTLSYERPHTRPLGLVVGLAGNFNRIHATSVPSDSTVVLNGSTISGTQAGVIFTDVTWNRIAPYVGVHLERPGGPGLYAEAGVFYQGTARVNFDATGQIRDNQKKFQPYYDAETKILRRELSPVQFYPVLDVGYRFRI